MEAVRIVDETLYILPRVFCCTWQMFTLCDAMMVA